VAGFCRKLTFNMAQYNRGRPEASELQEKMLWKTDDEVRQFIAKSDGKMEIALEIADVLIWALLFCHTTGIDPISAIREKLEENAKKYPEDLARGNAAKYTKLR
jgi:dCTP diphosphatase